MRAWPPRLVLSACLAVFVLAGLLAVGFVMWDPEPPRDPETAVLRVRFEGGMQGASFLPRRIPEVTVYGDGRIIAAKYVNGVYAARRMAMDGRLTRDAYGELYRDARLAGLGTSRRLHGDKQILDGGVTRVEFMAGGRRRSTTIEQGAEGPRAWMVDSLVDRLVAVPPDDLVRPATTYRAERTALVAWRPDRVSFGTTENVRPWPLTPLAEGHPRSCIVLMGTEAQEAERLVALAGSVAWRSGPHVYNTQVRPMLPDERDCAALR